MNNDTKVIETEVPANIDPTNLWILYYRHGPSPFPMFKFFYHPGKFGDVIERAKNHCTVMNTRFISIRPAIVNLAEEEKRQVSETQYV